LPILEHLGRDPWELQPPPYLREPLRQFWFDLRDRGLLTDEINAEFARLARRAAA
jgi:hypothetical protein